MESVYYLWSHVARSLFLLLYLDEKEKNNFCYTNPLFGNFMCGFRLVLEDIKSLCIAFDKAGSTG